MITQAQIKLLDQYNAALLLYKDRKFKEAKVAFEKALEFVPGDGPSKVYLKRCRTYIKNPPGEDWDGVFTMTTK